MGVQLTGETCKYCGKNRKLNSKGICESCNLPYQDGRNEGMTIIRYRLRLWMHSQHIFKEIE